MNTCTATADATVATETADVMVNTKDAESTVTDVIAEKKETDAIAGRKATMTADAMVTTDTKTADAEKINNHRNVAFTGFYICGPAGLL